MDEIRKLCEYPDRKIKPLIYTLCSSGIRLGAWDYLRWQIEGPGQVRVSFKGSSPPRILYLVQHDSDVLKVRELQDSV
jgi:hypothetical protein